MVSPYINRFIQPDTIVPDPSNPQAWNRFSYVHNNSINFNDPSGHCIWDLCILEIGVVSIGLVELSALTVAAIATIYVYAPGGQQRTQSLADNIFATGKHVVNQVNALFAKKKGDITFIEDLLRKHGLNPKKDKSIRRKLHDEEISGKGLTDEEIEAEIEEAARLKNKKKEDKEQKPK